MAEKVKYSFNTPLEEHIKSLVQWLLRVNDKKP